jgi:hypothetical protein
MVRRFCLTMFAHYMATLLSSAGDNDAATQDQEARRLFYSFFPGSSSFKANPV